VLCSLPLTQGVACDSEKAAIKLIPADPSVAEDQLLALGSNWRNV